jgi:hypothetical protein
MRFVATKTVDQLDLQALHRVRERLVGQRTGIPSPTHVRCERTGNHSQGANARLAAQSLIF